MKIFIKPDPGVSLRKYHRRLKRTYPFFSVCATSVKLRSLSEVERETLADIPNVYTYQSFVETEKAGYIIRQWVASSLYDRIR